MCLEHMVCTSEHSFQVKMCQQHKLDRLVFHSIYQQNDPHHKVLGLEKMSDYRRAAHLVSRKDVQMVVSWVVMLAVS